MDSDEEICSEDQLKRYNYRILQQIAKSMGLPSNVKKVYLIEMISAKKWKSAADLDNIIRKVKEERQQMSHIRKKRNRRLQGTEISSTNCSLSPPIQQTPRRGHFICSPDFKAIMKMKPKQTIQTNTIKTIKDMHSDRVLRSCNLKTVRPNYATFGGESPNYDAITTESSVTEEFIKQEQDERSFVVTKYRPAILSASNYVRKPTMKNSSTQANFSKRKLVNQAIEKPEHTAPTSFLKKLDVMRQFEQNCANREVSLANQANVMKKSEFAREMARQAFIKKTDSQSVNEATYIRKPEARQSTSQANLMRNLEIVSQSNNQANVISQTEMSQAIQAMTNISSPPSVPAKRQRILSGIYPLIPTNISVEQPNISYELQNVSCRREDGRITKINAFVRKTLKKPNLLQLNNIETAPVTAAPVTDYSISGSSHVNDHRYSERQYEKERENERYSIYYHKRIREQVRSQWSCQREARERLPKINDVFSRFNEMNDCTQPIYVQVSEPERITGQSYPLDTKTNTNLLETFYNFRNQFIVNQPLLKIATTNTYCVYSTRTIATAALQQSFTPASNDYMTSRARDDLHVGELGLLPRINDLLRYAENDVDFDEDKSTCSSLERSACQELGANVTIPEMEDALELISQDGDYMERIGLDRLQCIFCSWAGPDIMLEPHVRRDHPNEISKENKNEWTITFTLSSLLQRENWSCKVLENDSLYVLSVKHDKNDCLMVTLSTLTTEFDLPKTGSITIYNKVTGEPYSWEGEIQRLPPNMPHKNDLNCLKVDLSSLNLLPNSANLKLQNGELILKSPTKVVVGQPELNDIHVILFVKVLNLYK